MKIIFARRTSTPPVMDGILDDDCWGKAELRDDFTHPFFGTPVSRRTTLRCLYDDEHLYVGLQCEWDDGDAFAREIGRIEQKYSPIQTGIVAWEQFSYECCAELFLDPWASLANCYQIMFNAVGQVCGNYKAIDSVGFPLTPSFKAAVSDTGWTGEFALPIKDIPGASLKPGREWGLNICRNDASPYSLWKLVGERYREPKAFGRLIIGDYEEWWKTAWANGRCQALLEMREDLKPCTRNAPWIADLHKHALQLGRALDKTAAEHRPTNRENTEILYGQYCEFKRVFDRLETTIRIHKVTTEHC